MVLFRNIFMIVSLLTGIMMVFGYLIQSPKASGLGSISGQAQKFKVRKHRDIFLEKLTMWSAIIFGVTAFILSIANPDMWKM